MEISLIYNIRGLTFTHHPKEFRAMFLLSIFFPDATFDMMFDHKRLQRARFSFFSIITFCAIILVLHAYTDICHDSLRSSFANLKFPTTTKERKSTLSHVVVPSKPMQIEVDDENQKPLVPPLNLTKMERIDWFRKNLHEFKILNSNNLTRQFHTRVLRFLSDECEAQFFVTWISPARLFGNRELLSLETLFKAHPQACLIIVSRTLDSKRGNMILKPLIDRGFKVEAVTPDLPSLFQKTPAEAWLRDLRKGKKDPGHIPLPQNLSNLIRLVILYKYGGVYLDTDFIVLKSFKGLRNSIAAQSMDPVSKHWTRLNNAVLIFDKNHPLLFLFIEEFARTFNGNRWGYNGPYMVSRVVERLKEQDDLNFTILSPMAFYPVDWKQIGEFFKKPKNKDESIWIETKLFELRSGETYGVHLWNKQSSKLTIEEGSVVERLILDLMI